MCTDSRYTSSALFEKLHQQKSSKHGTIHMNKKGMPPQLHALKLQPEETSTTYRITVSTLSTPLYDNLLINKLVRKPAEKHSIEWRRFLRYFYIYEHNAMK